MSRRRARRSRDRPARRALRRAGAVALVWGCLALPASAADDPLEPPPLEDYLRWGPIRVRPGLAVTDAGYDSNVFNSPEPEGDYRITLAPRLEGLVLFGDRAFLTAEGEARYTAYASFRDLDYWDALTSARLTVPFRRFGPYFEASYDRIRQSPLDLDDARPVTTTAGAEIGLYAKIGARTTARLSRLDDDITNRDDDFGRTDLEFGDLLDRRERRDRLALDYEAFGRTTISLEAEAGDVRFRTPNLEGEPGYERDATSWRLGPAIRLGSGPISGELHLGWAEVDYAGERLLDFSGPVGDAALVARFAGRFTLRADAERRLGFSVTEGNAYWTYDVGSALLDVRIRRFFSLEGSVEAGTLDLPATGRRDDLTRWFGGVVFRIPESAIGRSVAYRLRFGRSRRDSSIDSLDRERNFVTVSADLGF